MRKKGGQVEGEGRARIEKGRKKRKRDLRVKEEITGKKNKTGNKKPVIEG